MVRPVKMGELLTMIREHLKKQQEAGKYTEQKVVEFIEARAKELDTHKYYLPECQR
jgi:hypothetical protein